MTKLLPRLVFLNELQQSSEKTFGPIIDRKCAQCGGWTKLPERATFKCSYCDTMGKEQLYH